MAQSKIITLVAETHIHPGIGQSTGALDLPVSRERTTHYPFIPGSGVKGAFRVWANERAGLNDDVSKLFGPEGQSKNDAGSDLGAGNLLCSDARLLLLPVRCISDAYKWVTCPAILRRFQRDIKRTTDGKNIDLNITVVKPKKYLNTGNNNEKLGLEEREFDHAGSIDDSITKLLSIAVGPGFEDDLKQRLIILSDTDFTWFARYALPVMARNQLADDTKESKNLWYEETLAPDTVMYLLLGERKSGAVCKIIETINPEQNARYIQIGGNETIGQGWFAMKVFSNAAGGGGNGA